jgi:hypothetical protein
LSRGRRSVPSPYRQLPGKKMSSGCPTAGFPVAVALERDLLLSAPLRGCRILYKGPLSPGLAYPAYMPPTRLCCSWLASLWSLASTAPVEPLHALIKCHLGILLSSPAWAFNGKDLDWLLVQPALRSKPAFAAGCHGDPSDASRQVAPPLAYPDNQPHNR